MKSLVPLLSKKNSFSNLTFFLQFDIFSTLIFFSEIIRVVPQIFETNFFFQFDIFYVSNKFYTHFLVFVTFYATSGDMYRCQLQNGLFCFLVSSTSVDADTRRLPIITSEGDRLAAEGSLNTSVCLYICAWFVRCLADDNKLTFIFYIF